MHLDLDVLCTDKFWYKTFNFTSTHETLTYDSVLGMKVFRTLNEQHNIPKNITVKLQEASTVIRKTFEKRIVRSKKKINIYKKVQDRYKWSHIL